MKKVTHFILSVIFFISQMAVLYCQKPITHILTDPTKLNKAAFNIGLQFQIQEMPQMALYAAFYQATNNFSTETNTRFIETRTQTVEARFFPFQTYNSKKGKQNLSMCEKSCFKNKNHKDYAPILRGVYFAPGIVFENTKMDSSATFNAENALKANPFLAKTRAFSLALGYQIPISVFTVGINNQVAFRKTTISGNLDMLKNTPLLEQLLPNRTHLTNTLRLEVGIHF